MCIYFPYTNRQLRRSSPRQQMSFLVGQVTRNDLDIRTAAWEPKDDLYNRKQHWLYHLKKSVNV